jgi:hypothetical protein
MLLRVFSAWTLQRTSAPSASNFSFRAEKIPGAFFIVQRPEGQSTRKGFVKKCLEHFFIAQQTKGQNTGMCFVKKVTKMSLLRILSARDTGASCPASTPGLLFFTAHYFLIFAAQKCRMGMDGRNGENAGAIFGLALRRFWGAR